MEEYKSYVDHKNIEINLTYMIYFLHFKLYDILIFFIYITFFMHLDRYTVKSIYVNTLSL